jgi:hypothetical protein
MLEVRRSVVRGLLSGERLNVDEQWSPCYSLESCDQANCDDTGLEKK